MAQTDDERRAYSRGYQAGLLRGRRDATGWPAHCPPHPPEPHVRRLMAALKALRDGTGAELSTLDQDDPWVVKLGPAVDEADAALEEVGRWLKEQVADARGLDGAQTPSAGREP